MVHNEVATVAHFDVSIGTNAFVVKNVGHDFLSMLTISPFSPPSQIMTIPKRR